MPEDGLAPESGILLGQWAPKSGSPARSDNESSASSHGVLDNIGLGRAHFALLQTPPGPAIARPNYCALHKLPII